MLYEVITRRLVRIHVARRREGHPGPHRSPGRRAGPRGRHLVFAGAAVASAGPAGEAIMAASSIEAECAYLLRECERGRAARAADPGWLEHPSGMVFATTSPEAALHVV